MKFIDHLIDILSKAQIEKILGYLYMFGLICYLMYLALSHKKDFWEAIRGSNEKLEMPELIIAFCLILYINIVIADVFLGLKASDGVFWSLDSIILFALTHRVFSPKTKDDITNQGIDVNKTNETIENIIDKKE